MVLAFYKYPGIPEIRDIRQAGFVGFFGPMGVSAIFYLYTSREFLRSLVVYEGHERADAERLAEILNVVVWFVVISSIVTHGISIPVGKLWFYLPAALSRDNTSPLDKNDRETEKMESQIDEPASLTGERGENGGTSHLHGEEDVKKV